MYLYASNLIFIAQPPPQSFVRLEKTTFYSYLIPKWRNYQFWRRQAVRQAHQWSHLKSAIDIYNFTYISASQLFVKLFDMHLLSGWVQFSAGEYVHTYMKTLLKIEARVFTEFLRHKGTHISARGLGFRRSHYFILVLPEKRKFVYLLFTFHPSCQPWCSIRYAYAY